MTVSPGIAEFLAGRGDSFRRSRVALLGHAASVLPDLTHDLDALVAAGFNVVAVLAPEHGFRGSAQPGHTTGAGVDPATGTPVLDAYSTPMADAVAATGADVILVDLQHVGARFYTYESSLYDLIEVAARSGVRVVVCDRPNPVTGNVVAGPVLKASAASFAGRAALPARHGMTIGELALLFAGAHQATEQVEIVAMTGWQRGTWFDQTGLTWVPPSPNLPGLDAVQCYLGCCLLEATNLSVGRGSTTPFQLIGAPWMDSRLATALRALDLPGVQIREAHAIPRYDAYAGEQICGLQLHITHRSRFDPLRMALEIIVAAQRLWPDHLAIAEGRFDHLAGTARLRHDLMAGVRPADIVDAWSTDMTLFAPVRAACLIYGGGERARR